MTYAAQETGATSGAPVELYEFSILTGKWHFTDADAEIEYDGDTYAPIPIRRTAPEQSREGGHHRVTVSVPRDCEIPLAFRVYVPLSPMSLVIRRKHRDDAEAIVFWSGRVRAVRWEGEDAHLECEPISAQMTRDGLRYQYQATCNHLLYGPYCGVDKLAYKTVGVVTVIDGATVQADAFAGEDDGWFTTGMVVRDLDYRFVIGHVGATLTLLLPFENVAVGDALDAYAGCPRSKEICKNRFANLDNFGGFPFVPNKNPFSKGLT